MSSLVPLDACNIWPVAPVAFDKFIFEPGVSQLREFESPRVQIRKFRRDLLLWPS